MKPISSPEHSQALLALLDEAFDCVHGFFLDPHNSLFVTLGEISSATASIPVGGKCATIAEQVRHTAYCLDVYVNCFRNPGPLNADWGKIWRTVHKLSPKEWNVIQVELRHSNNRFLDLIRDTQDLQNEREIGDAFAIIAHTAHHLGEIRQALCTLQ